jgi:hypothetical protein
MQKVVFYWIVLGSILFTISHVKAQSFKVQQFRPLPNDISAFINPEYDLNHEACALLKIVCEDRFAFSTPLGIIRRKNNVGEVWLYVPHNTRLITIKHPTWGVLRDYCLPIALESRMTYELVITPPLTVQMTQFLHIDRQPTRLLHSARMTALYPDALPITDKIQTPIKLETFVSATATIGNSTLLPGIRAGIMKKHGGYLSVHTDFGNWTRNQTGICDANGYLPTEGYTPYYTGNTSSGELLVTAGAIHRLHQLWYIYEGIGYGIRRIYWECTTGEWIRYSPGSHEGWIAETGVMFRHHHYLFSGGLSTLRGTDWMGVLGIGYCF